MSAVLSEIKTREVSLVDRGANRKRIALHKQERRMASKTKMTKAQKDTLAKALAGLKVGKAPERLLKALAELSEPARQAVLAAVSTLAAAKADLPDGLLQDVLTAVGVESPDDLIDLLAGVEPEEPGEPDAVSSDNPPAPGADSPPPNPEEPMVAQPTKSETPVAKLDEAAKAQIAKAEKSAAEANTKLAELQKQAEVDKTARVELEKQIKAERDVRLEKEFVAKAEKLSHLPVKPSELGPVLKALHDVAPEQAAKVEKFLEQTNEKLKTVDTLLKEKGLNTVHDNETSAWAQLQKAAAELMKAEPKLTEPQAITKAMELNKGLYDQYLAEQKGRAA